MKSRLKTGWKSKSIAVIHIDQDLLKIVSAKNGGTNPLSLIAVYPIKGIADADIALMIKKCIKQANISDANFILSIPRHWVNLKILTLPTLKDEEIFSMIEFQVARLVPYPKAEIVFDYQKLKTLPNQYSLVRVAITHQKAIEHSLQILSLAHIHPQSVSLGTETLASLFPNCDKPTCIIEVDYAQTHIVFIYENIVYFSRSVMIGCRELLSKEHSSIQALNDFLTEVESSISLFPSDQHPEKISYHALGPSQALERIVGPLQEKLKAPIQISTNTSVLAELIIGEELLNVSSVHHLLTLLHLPGSFQSFNLMPADYSLSFIKKQSQSLLNKMAFSLFAMFFLGFCAFFFEVNLEQRYLNSLKAHVKSIEKQALEIEILRNKMVLLKEHIDHRGECLDVLATLFQSLPESISVKTIFYDPIKLTLRGYAPTLSKIFELTAILEKNTLFGKIETKSAQQTSAGALEVAEFHIECSIDGNRRDDPHA